MTLEPGNCVGVTGEDGRYSFTSVPGGTTYSVTPR